MSLRSSKMCSTLPVIKTKIGSQNKFVFNLSLLDTGSTLNLINRKYFSELIDNKIVKIAYNVSEKLYTANDSTININSYCYLNVKIDRFSWLQKFFVCDNLSWNLILGVPFIEETRLILNLHDNTLCFPFDVNHKIKLRNVSTKKVYNVNLSLQVGIQSCKDNVQKLVSKYNSVFTEKLGEALDFEVQLKLTNTEPVKLRPYQLNPVALKQMKQITDKWLEQGVITPAISAYSSPAFLVNKGDKPRLVINYSKVNKYIEPISYPIGDLHNCYNYLNDAKIFTVLDLSQSFLQIPLAKESQHITAFSTMYESFIFKRVPFGLHLGSGILSHYLNKVLGSAKYDYCINYIDDLIIYSKTIEEHMIHLESIIKKLGEHKLTVNQHKTRFCFNEISFLGHIIKDGTIRIDPDRTKAIQNCKVPKNVKQLSSFIGMINYFNKYIPNYASICSVLNNLRKKNVPYIWTEDCQKAFLTLKQAIMSPPVLHLPCFENKFILMTDASENGIGGCLMQEKHGNRVPIAYFSRRMSNSELAYSIYEKECLSVIACFAKFNQFLQLKPFLLITDNLALSWVLSHKRKLGRLSRWVAQIMSLSFEIQHCKSKDNPVSDYLSRMYSSNSHDSESSTTTSNVCEEENVNNLDLSKNRCSVNNTIVDEPVKAHVNLVTDIPLAFMTIKEHQALDPETLELINHVKNKTGKDNYYIYKDVLMFKKNQNSKGKIVAPTALFSMLFQYYHVSTFGGHLGYKKTIDKLCRYFYHPKLLKEFKTRIQNCEICKMAKPAQRYYSGPLVATHAEQGMERLYIDILGPMTRSTKGNNNMLIVVDDYSKYTWLFPLKDAKAKPVIQKLKDVIFTNYSVAKSIVSDNGSIFRSNEFKNFMFKYGIEHRRLSPYRPSGNRSERYIRNVKNQLRCYYHSCQNLWDKDISDLQLCLNLAKNESTKFSAFELLYNFNPNHSLSNLWTVNSLVNTEHSKEEIVNKLRRAIINVKKSVTLNQRRGKYNEPKHPFQVGNRVTVKTHYLSKKINKFSAGLALRFLGSYKILFFITPVTCIIQNEKDLLDVRKTHIGELKML